VEKALDRKKSVKSRPQKEEDNVEKLMANRMISNKLQSRFQKLITKKFAEEILEEQTPLLQQFNRVFTRMEKIIKKHPTEVLKNPKTLVWTKIMQMLFDLQKNPKLRHKEYARNWLKQYQVRVVKIVAQNIEFE